MVEVPSPAKDDVTGHVLDIGLTYKGMLRELRALELLAVGDVIWHVDPKQKVISTQWVSNAKAERVEERENHIVRCIENIPVYAGSKRQNIVGLDVSTRA